MHGLTSRVLLAPLSFDRARQTLNHNLHLSHQPHQPHRPQLSPRLAFLPFPTPNPVGAIISRSRSGIPS